MRAPNRCPSCGGVSFVAVPNVEIEIHRSSRSLGRLGVNLLACEACGRLELFGTNAAHLLQTVPGAVRS
ncbi:MAG: hypothetical protein JNL38_09715 [Myxococcales bacterium]|nr:hypothetical protein [Myxococcales bacterium]